MELNTFIPAALVTIGFILVTVELLLGIDSLFDLVLSGLSLVIAGTIGYFINSWEVSLVLAILLLVAYWFAGYKFLRKFLQVKYYRTNAERLLDQKSTITRVSTDEKSFYAKFFGEEWTVFSDQDLKLNDKIIVTATHGAKLEVKKI